MPVTRETLVDWFAEHAALDPASLADDTKLFSSSLVDSFAMVDLLLWLEQEGGRTILAADVSLDNLDSVGAILDYLARPSRR